MISHDVYLAYDRSEKRSEPGQVVGLALDIDDGDNRPLRTGRSGSDGFPDVMGERTGALRFCARPDWARGEACFPAIHESEPLPARLINFQSQIRPVLVIHLS